RVIAQTILAETLWLQGLPDQAVRAAERSIDHAQSLDHTLSSCIALGLCACPIALLTGDLAAAERYVAMLLRYATTLTLRVWHAFGRCFDGILNINRGDLVRGENTLRAGLGELSEAKFALRRSAFVAELACAHERTGETAKAHATIDEALERCQRNEEFWYLPELLRIKGEILLREGKSHAAAAAD